MYEKYRTVNSALKNQMLAVFDNFYLLTLNNKYTGYATRSTMEIIAYLYEKYACISSTDMAENYERLRLSYNTEELLESLTARLNKCVDFATTASEPILETQKLRIT